MRDDFCVFIISHGRPDRVVTYDTLRKAGYTGRIFIVIDDQDKSADQYFAKYPNEVFQFNKDEVAARLDEGDNSGKRVSTIYPRAACFDIAPTVGCRFFIQLDDDYTSFVFRLTKSGKMIKKTMNDLLAAMLEYYERIPALSIAMSQGGDHMGGHARLGAGRKAMNSFICSTDRPFYFVGRMNEDVNTYVTEGRKGKLFLTILPIQLNQIVTQKNAGGMTELYLDRGTYVKSFYSVMYCPSSVKVGFLRDPRHEHGRIHHMINWNKTVPKILRQNFRRSQNLS
jgi:hypothetical protein